MPTVRVIDDDEVREPGSYAPIAVVRVSREELRQCGVALRTPVEDGTWDEAGPIQEAVIETPSGEQPLLIWHLVFEEHPDETGNKPALELRAPVSVRDATAYVAVTLATLDLPLARAEWIVAPEDWPPVGRL